MRKHHSIYLYPTLILIFSFAASLFASPQTEQASSEDAPASLQKIAAPRASEPPKSKKAASDVTGDELVHLAWTDLSGLRGVLLHGANPNARTRVGDYPIIRLAFGGNVEAVEILLDFNARTNVVNLPGSANTTTALKSLTSFVAEREKLDLKNFSVATAIIEASPQVTEIQKIKMMQLILDYGFPADFRDGWGRTALMSCVQKNRTSLAKLLVAYGADSEANDLFNGKTPRDYANSEEMFRILRGRKIYTPGKRPSYGKIDVRLVRPPRYPKRPPAVAPKKILQATKESALHLAAEDGDIENVRNLLSAGAQAISHDLEQKTPLHVLCEKQEIPFSAFRQIYDLLEQKSGSKILLARDKQGRIPFHYLCHTGREDLAKFLLKKNPKQLLTADSNQDTPLHFAVHAGENGRDMMHFLLREGAPVDRKNEAEETPLTLAVKQANIETFYLLFQGLDIDPVTGINSLVGDPLFLRTCNLISASPGRSKANENLTEILRILIENGTNPNLVNSATGRNALHCAVAANCLSAVSFLLTTTIDVNKRDHLGATPLDIAQKTDKTGTIIALLQKHNARPGKSASEDKQAEREKRSKMNAKERRAAKIDRTLKNQ